MLHVDVCVVVSDAATSERVLRACILTLLFAHGAAFAALRVIGRVTWSVSLRMSIFYLEYWFLGGVGLLHLGVRRTIENLYVQIFRDLCHLPIMQNGRRLLTLVVVVHIHARPLEVLLLLVELFHLAREPLLAKGGLLVAD